MEEVTRLRFSRGDVVRLRADRAREGVITDGPRPGAGGFDYEVFLDGSRAWYAEGALLPSEKSHLRWQTRDELLRDLLLAKLRNPLTDSLYAYRASRTEFAAYQFRPALKFLRNPNRGLLIADEVGLGKTIEAAIIYLELKARMDISRVMVLCPARLTFKWQAELHDRFEEQFQILDGPGARQLLSEFQRLGDTFPIRVIASFELMRRSDFVDQLSVLNIPLDLLIVDEAHHLRNAATATHRLAETLVNSSDAVLFLTATPLHLRNLDLFNLLSLLAPDDFDSPDYFEEQVRPNQHVTRAIQLVAANRLAEAALELKRVEQTGLRQRFLSNPFYREAVARLELGSHSLPLEERVKLQRELLELNTLSTVFTRTRKREIADAAVRAPFSILVELTDAERAFYEGVLLNAREEALRSGWGPGFATVMKERQAASCLVAMREVFEEAHSRRTPATLAVDRSPFDLHGADEDDRAPTSEELLALSRRIGSTDSKFEVFNRTLHGALAADPTSKALVFSFFRRTLEYLRRRLGQEGAKVEMIHGGISVGERRRIIERFRTDPDLRVLLSSEVGAEGLDFEFCDVLVNYDLPWNPMQVEQRIGRLDRFGQKHPRIRIYNLFLADTVETRIFQRLYERIGVFQRSIGDLEEILGEVILDLSRKALQAHLTPEEQERLADQAAAVIVRRQQEEEELERHKDELLGQGHILDQQVDEAVNSGRVISAEEVRALVMTFLGHNFPRATMVKDDDEPCWTLDFDIELSEYLRRYVEQRRLHHRVSEKLQVAMNKNGRVALTFDSDYARQRPNLEFVTIRHPLAEAARDYWSRQDLSGIPASAVQVTGPADEVGDGSFFVYVLSVRAVAERVTLEPVIVLDDGRLAPVSGSRLLRELQLGRSQAESLGPWAPEDQANAAKVAAAIISQRRTELEREMRQRNDALLSVRAMSIQSSFDTKIRRTQELLAEASNERIVRMRRAQIARLQARRQAKLDALERDREVVVSYELIAAGRVRVIPEPVSSSWKTVAESQEPAMAMLSAEQEPLAMFVSTAPSVRGRAETATSSDLTPPTRGELGSEEARAPTPEEAILPVTAGEGPARAFGSVSAAQENRMEPGGVKDPTPVQGGALKRLLRRLFSMR